MADVTQISAITRKTAEVGDNPQGLVATPALNNRNDLSVAIGLPLRSELTRMGRSWGCRIATASAFTYVAAWPTTRGELVLYNGEPAGGKCYLIEEAWMYNITSMAAAQPMTLIGQLVPVGSTTAPANDTAQLISSRNGRVASGYDGNAKRAVANTAMGQTTNLWDVLASITAPMTTNLGAALEVDLYGKYILPPGAGFALAGIAGTAAGTAIIGVNWSELQLAIGP